MRVGRYLGSEKPSSLFSATLVRGTSSTFRYHLKHSKLPIITPYVTVVMIPRLINLIKVSSGGEEGVSLFFRSTHLKFDSRILKRAPRYPMKQKRPSSS